MDRLANIAAFVRVVENGGFTAAARHLNVSPTRSATTFRSWRIDWARGS
jgi:DNA-binding transcriptional LysR family regulator